MRIGVGLVATLFWLAQVAIAIWSIYLIYKVAQHVNAWPF